MFCFPFSSLNLIFLNSAIQNFQIKVFEERFDMNGGKEEAAKVDKSLNYCTEVAGGKQNILSLISPLQETLPFPVRKREKTKRKLFSFQSFKNLCYFISWCAQNVKFQEEQFVIIVEFAGPCKYLETNKDVVRD